MDNIVVLELRITAHSEEAIRQWAEEHNVRIMRVKKREDCYQAYAQGVTRMVTDRHSCAARGGNS